MRKTYEEQKEFIKRTGLCPECGRSLEGRVLIEEKDHTGKFLGFMCMDRELHTRVLQLCRVRHLIPGRLLEVTYAALVELDKMVHHLQELGFEDKYIDTIMTALPSFYHDHLKRFKKKPAGK